MYLERRHIVTGVRIRSREDKGAGTRPVVMAFRCIETVPHARPGDASMAYPRQNTQSYARMRENPAEWGCSLWSIIEED